jgi:hypothetical protein
MVDVEKLINNSSKGTKVKREVPFVSCTREEFAQQYDADYYDFFANLADDLKFDPSNPNLEGETLVLDDIPVYDYRMQVRARVLYDTELFMYKVTSTEVIPLSKLTPEEMVEYEISEERVVQSKEKVSRGEPEEMVPVHRVFPRVGIRLLGDFFKKGFIHYDMVGKRPYAAALGEAYTFSDGFLTPDEYMSTSTLWQLGTRTRDKTNRLRYKDTKFGAEWERYRKRRVELFGLYTRYTPKVLAKAKKCFEEIPGFSVDSYCPRGFNEALLFFHVYGPPAATCKDHRKIRLFFACLVSGFYYERDTLMGFGQIFFERRLLMTQGLFDVGSASSEYDSMFRRKGLVRRTWGRVLNAVKNGFSRVSVGPRRLFKRVSNLAVLERLKYFLNNVDLISIRYVLKIYARIVRPHIFPWIFSPFRSWRSHQWKLVPPWLEVYLLAIYILFVEIYWDARSWLNSGDEEDVETHSDGDDIWWYYLTEIPMEFLYDIVYFNVMLVLRPILDFFVNYPFWFFVAKTSGLTVNVHIMWNNFWHRVLTFGNRDSKVRGRWWKIPVILVRNLIMFTIGFYVFLFLAFYVNFIVCIDALQPYIFFSLYSTEVHTVYITAVFIFVLRFFGPNSIRDLMRDEFTWDDWLNLLYAELHLAYNVSPYNMPTTAWYPEGIEEFSDAYSTKDIGFSRDKVSLAYIHSNLMPYTYAHKHNVVSAREDLAAYGDDYKLMEEWKRSKA